ncbi:hypothetical protein [Aurantimonas sp. Leaf443]|uniref:hypothetical protein n=1 Tax=Aurantimonas sp. Leaf443 TaxID=1736378 RepID=UPI0006F7D6F8|nr:hypothetical protein [Aurantimonas sp. Leaf443]KQT87434.1 hypothetical protein ASG48_16680 [Aurantimonas sp. Leaf443]
MTICLVGNAPGQSGAAEAIDACGTVLRFNNAHGFGAATGRRVTHLFLVNCGGQMREWLDDPQFEQRPQVSAAPAILLPIHPDKDDAYDPPLTAAERAEPDGRNHAGEALARLAAEGGRTVEILPARLFLKACRVIGYARPERGMAAPSTGLIGLLWALERVAPGERIEAYGFGFEGWPGHRFEAERRFFEAQAERGRLALHPPGR